MPVRYCTKLNWTNYYTLCEPNRTMCWLYKIFLYTYTNIYKIAENIGKCIQKEIMSSSSDYRKFSSNILLYILFLFIIFTFYWKCENEFFVRHENVISSNPSRWTTNLLKRRINWKFSILDLPIIRIYTRNKIK